MAPFLVYFFWSTFGPWCSYLIIRLHNFLVKKFTTSLFYRGGNVVVPIRYTWDKLKVCITTYSNRLMMPEILINLEKSTFYHFSSWPLILLIFAFFFFLLPLLLLLLFIYFSHTEIKAKLVLWTDIFWILSKQSSPRLPPLYFITSQCTVSLVAQFLLDQPPSVKCL